MGTGRTRCCIYIMPTYTCCWHRAALPGSVSMLPSSGGVVVPWLLLTASHHVAWRPPNWLGAVPITAQTLAVCVNAVCAAPSASLGSLSCYLGLGAVAALAPVRVAAVVAPFGPTFSKGTIGFVLGFVPGSLVTTRIFQHLCPAAPSKEDGSGVEGAEGRRVFSAAVLASGAGQLVVLACGSLWIGLKFRMGVRGTLDAGFLPFLPGLGVKSVMCGATAAAVSARVGDSR